MLLGQNSYKLELALLKKLQKSLGFTRLRYNFLGTNTKTSKNDFFFIEVYAEKMSDSCSKVFVRVGKYQGAESFFEREFGLNEINVQGTRGSIGGDSFLIDPTSLTGLIASSKGVVSWSLKINRKASYRTKRGRGDIYWSISGLNACFSGELFFGSETYIVSPGVSNGYIDEIFGKKLPSPFFNLTCHYIESSISGKKTEEGNFVVQGGYCNFIAFVCNIGSLFIRKNCAKKMCHYSFSDFDEKFHWTVSLPYKKYLVDLDVYIPKEDLISRKYLSLEDGVDTISFGGASGSGELRVYRKKGKSLEILDHFVLQNVLCEHAD